MMDVQTAPPPYTAAGSYVPTAGNPPMLGQQIPGMTGGLPALSGLSVTANPMAQELQNQGRGEDSMLVHMTPDEVNSLQGLALATGGSLTINPATGLPEAGWLGKLLPTILGAALAATGVGAPLAAGIVGAGQFARTGSLKKGLMAGLGAFGGAGMAGMAGVGGKLAGGNAFGMLSDKAGMFGANMGLGAAANPVATYLNSPELAQQFAEKFGTQTAGAASPAGSFGASMEKALNAPELVAQRGADITSSAMAKAPIIAAPAGPAAIQGGGAQFTGGLGSRFAQATRAGLPGGTPGIVSKLAPKAALMGVTSGVSGALSGRPSGSMGDDGVIDNSYTGPYTAQQRKATFADSTADILGSSKERRYFDVDMPEIYNMQGQVVQPGSSTAPGTPILQNVINPAAKKGQNRYTPTFVPYMSDTGFGEEGYMGYAEGGEVQIADGGFIVDARSVAEGGGGYTEAGFEEFKKLGGVPIKGPGNGVSDSIPARIGGTQPARVAAGEVYMSPEAVRRIGKGDPKRGANKLYAMMNEAHKATKRGQERNILRGLA